MEGTLVERESTIPFVALPATGLRGRNPLGMARGAFVLSQGVRAGIQLLRRERPAAILGTGGYVCVPLFVAAAIARIPTLLYLPDIVPGWAGRVLGRLATRIAVTFADSAQYLPAHKVIETGYPVRPEFFQLKREDCRAAFGLQAEPPVLLVYGGSRGARAINQAIGALLPHLVQWAQVLHLCGREGDLAWLQAAQAQLPAEYAQRYQVFEYLHADSQQSMAAAFGAADLAVCRAGASVLGELPAVGLGAILIPLTAVKQEYNAQALVDRGAALCLHNDTLSGSGEPGDGPLGRELYRLLHDPEARRTLATNSARIAHPQAREQLARLWWSLARGG